VYRHSDGYSESVFRDLAQLKDFRYATRAEREPGDTAAPFVFLDELSATFIKNKENTRAFRRGMNPTILTPSTFDGTAGYSTCSR
jgi:hypothetical protein